MKTYQDSDYISECGQYITTPEIKAYELWDLLIPVGLCPVFCLIAGYLFSVIYR